MGDIYMMNVVECWCALIIHRIIQQLILKYHRTKEDLTSFEL